MIFLLKYDWRGVVGKDPSHPRLRPVLMKPAGEETKFSPFRPRDAY